MGRGASHAILFTGSGHSRVVHILTRVPTSKTLTIRPHKKTRIDINDRAGDVHHGTRRRSDKGGRGPRKEDTPMRDCQGAGSAGRESETQRAHVGILLEKILKGELCSQIV